MDAVLEKLSKQELILLLNAERKAAEEKVKLQASIQAKQQEVDYLKAKVAQLQRMLFGQKRERFENPDQLNLPFSPAQEQIQQQEEALTEKIEYVRKKQQKTTHKGRVTLPDHLPVEEVEIYPEGDLSEMTCIGKEVTEELESVPARFFIRRYIRYKYAPKTKDAVLIGELPERVIERGIPGPGLIASILVDKYVDHLPLYRQRQRFLRENIPVAASTLDGWARQGMERLSILYEHLIEDIKGKGYLQVDESPIRVLDSNKKGACHKGYYWVYHSPLDSTVLFNYQPTRAEKATLEMLGSFKGYLQSDGYSVYKKIAKRSEVTHLVCWAHARREFEKALSNDQAKAQIALTLIQQLYAVEAQAREGKFTAQERKELRLEKALPVINAMGKWISQTVKETLPKSQIGKAMQYSIDRWSELSVYLFDGELEIDNNLIENAIRPVALGRKNYLFAGSHDAAQRAAMMRQAFLYTFFANCKKHDVNPYQWLKYTLENIMSINHKNIKDLYPQNFKSKM